MPYQPTVRGAELADLTFATEPHVYRLGGNSCLSGDFMGAWRFDKPLEIGDEVIFEDMIHYTTVKTTMFNGVTHPSIGLLTCDGKLDILRDFGYEDYFYSGHLCFIEWPELVEPLLPEGVVKVQIVVEDNEQRSILID